jgi:hypothetical protein
VSEVGEGLPASLAPAVRPQLPGPPVPAVDTPAHNEPVPARPGQAHDEPAPFGDEDSGEAAEPQTQVLPLDGEQAEKPRRDDA